MIFLFNEQSAIEKMIKMNVVDNENVFATIKDLARYNHFVYNMDNDQNYKSILLYLQKYGKNINEEDVYQIIDKCVQKAKKQPFRKVDIVPITKSELDFIEGLGDIKQEKIAFVLLASAKYYDVTRDSKQHTSYMRNADICKLARVTIPVKDRDVFMQFAYDKGVLKRHSRAASTEKKVAFVSDDESDTVVLKLQESDYMDLAYTYLSFKAPHKFRKCVTCKRWMRRTTNDNRLCKECATIASEYKNTVKEIQCVECGKPIYISIMNSKTCRCDSCQDEVTKKSKRDWWNRNCGENTLESASES